MEFIRIGKIVDTHGMNGDVKILPMTDNPEFYDVLSFLMLAEDGKVVQSLDVVGMRSHHEYLICSSKQLGTIDAAESGDEIVVGRGVYNENIDFKGKNLTIRSIDPNDPTVVASAVINGSNQQPVVTFSGGENALCVLVGFTITGGKRGIFCSQASPTIINCIITGNTTESAGGGISCENIPGY